VEWHEESGIESDVRGTVMMTGLCDATSYLLWARVLDLQTLFVLRDLLGT
jgi:hypothetical protein